MAKLLWVLFITLVVQACGYRILVVFPMPARSHGILGEALVRPLLEAGHQVTYITPVPMKSQPNLEQVDVSANFNLLTADFIKLLIKPQFNLQTIDMRLHTTFRIANTTIHNENVYKLLSDTRQTFDVVIVEWMFSELLSGIPLLYDCPLIWLSSIDPHWSIMSIIDEPTNPAYVPDTTTAKLPPFTFWERTKQFFMQNFFYIIKNTYLTWLESTEYERYYGPLLKIRVKRLPSYNDAKYNGSLILGNSHVSAGQSVSLPQSYKPILGYHIRKTFKPLPEDLQNVLDNAKHGVIYFSLGSNVKSKDLPSDVKKNLLKMFSERKETVLWKFEEDLPNLPKNVHIMKWAPQQSILAHPNCILFITHGGLLSTTESIHYGKPMIGLPGFADQHNNMHRAERKGYGIKVDLLSPNLVEELKVALDEIIENPKYAEKAKELSAIYHDRPVSPEKEMLFWIEHVVRTRGARHLRSPALDVPLYQKMYLDLALVILLILICTKTIVTRLLCSTNKSDKKRKVE